MKQTKILLLILAMVMPMMVSADPVEIDGIYYNLISKGPAAEVTKNPNKYSGDIIIPETVTYEGVDYVVKSIGEEAFQHCKDLSTIKIPNSVTRIGKYAFAWCNSLSTISIPNGVSSIGDESFACCENLVNVTIPNSVTDIGLQAFYGCVALEKIIIPESVTSLGGGAFRYCQNLTSITLSNSITGINAYTFCDCSNLSTVTIPQSVTYIYDYAFSNCGELKEIYSYANNVPFTTSKAFDNSYPEYITLHVPAASIEAYKASEPWKNFKEIVAIDGSAPGTEKCATPTITYKDGKLSFSCDTEGVEYVTSVECLDNKTFYDNEIQLSGKFRVSVYATKSGYDNSDVATAEIDVRGLKGDVNGDGKVTITDAVEVMDIILNNGSAPN